MDLTNHVKKIGGRHTFKEITSRAGFEGALDLNVPFKSRQYDDAGFRKFGANGYHRVNSTHVGKPQVHKSDVRFVFPKTLSGVASVCGLSHHNHVWCAVNKNRNALPNQLVVVYTEHTYAR